MNPTLLELKDISIIRDGKKVLSCVNWTIKQGEHWVLMGPNGSGKTTLLEIASGYLWPMQGEVYLLGEKLGETYLPDLRKKVGFVAPWVLNRVQSYIPVKDVVASGLEASIGYVDQISKDFEKKIRHQLNFFEASDLIDRPFGKLSSGEKLKVILSRSLISHPHLLILDEPFAHLDLTTRYHCYDFLEKLSCKKDAPAIILVTHYLEDVRPLFSKALLLKDGQVAALGQKNEVLTPSVMSKIFHLSKKGA